MTTQIITHYYVKKTIIHLRLILDGKRSEISTHKKIEPATLAVWPKRDCGATFLSPETKH